MTFACVLGAGIWRPATVRTKEAWPSNFAEPPGGRVPEVFTHVTTRPNDPCAAIVQRYLATEGGDPFLGTRERRVADATTSIAEAQAHAARAALADAGVEPGDVDVVLSTGYLPDRPGIPCAPRVIKALGLESAAGYDVDNAYASALSQLVLARSLVAARHARNVLLTQSHLITRAVPLSHRVSPNFGDLASALVVGPGAEPGILATHVRTHAEFADAIVWARSDGAPWWQAGGEFALGSLDVRGTEAVIAGTVKTARDMLLDLCTKERVSPKAVRALCAVQPRGWLPAAIAEAAGFADGSACDTFGELAHVGACGVVANLLEARRRLSLARGDLVALYAQGAGLTCVAALLRMN